MKKITFYRRIRDVLMAVSERKDSQIIATCKVLQPIADDKGKDIPIRNKVSNCGMIRVKSLGINANNTDRIT